MQKEIHTIKYRLSRLNSARGGSASLDLTGQTVILPRSGVFAPQKTLATQKAKLFNWVKWLLKEKYHGKPNKQFKKDIKRLKNGEPLDYVIGFTEFLGCKINVSKNPLIPRQETEYWVQKTIEEMSHNLQSFADCGTKVLDMFAGSGCIGIAILKHIKNSNVTFAEKNKKFLEQIKVNLKINKKLISNSHELEIGLQLKRYKIIQSDVFKNVVRRHDYIFANPPYISTKRNRKVQKSVLQYEPKEALFGGEDGLLYIRKFLAEAKNFLNPGGRIFMEFDSIQKREIERMLKKFKYKSYKFNRDQYGKWRWLDLES